MGIEEDVEEVKKAAGFQTVSVPLASHTGVDGSVHGGAVGYYCGVCKTIPLMANEPVSGGVTYAQIKELTEKAVYGPPGSGTWADPNCGLCIQNDCKPGHHRAVLPTEPKTLPKVKGGNAYNAVEPPHYKRGPLLHIELGEQATMGVRAIKYTVQCIQVMRHIKDPRLATAFKYLWRVAFGGKSEPWDSRAQRDIDTRDLKSAIWYLQDYLDNPVE